MPEQSQKTITPMMENSNWPACSFQCLSYYGLDLLKSPYQYNSLENVRSFSFKDKIAQAQDTMIC